MAVKEIKEILTGEAKLGISHLYLKIGMSSKSLTMADDRLHRLRLFAILNKLAPDFLNAS